MRLVRWLTFNPQHCWRGRRRGQVTGPSAPPSRCPAARTPSPSSPTTRYSVIMMMMMIMMIMMMIVIIIVTRTWAGAPAGTSWPPSAPSWWTGSPASTGSLSGRILYCVETMIYIMWDVLQVFEPRAESLLQCYVLWNYTGEKWKLQTTVRVRFITFSGHINSFSFPLPF